MASVPTILRLGRADAGRIVSSEEYAEASFEEPWRYERVEGRLVVMAPCGGGHLRTSEPWRDRLGAYKLAHPELVDLVASEAWIRPDVLSDRIADIGVYLTPPPPGRDVPDVMPDLAFEIVSPGRVANDRDYLTKRAEYSRFGIREYVIIDRFRRAVTVLTAGADGYDERTLRVGDTYTTLLLPGFAVVLAEVF